MPHWKLTRRIFTSFSAQLTHDERGKMINVDPKIKASFHRMWLLPGCLIQKEKLLYSTVSWLPTTLRVSSRSCLSTTVLCSACEAHFYLYFQALIYDHSGKNVEIELFDEDTDKDDFLGWYDFFTKLTEPPVITSPSLFPQLKKKPPLRVLFCLWLVFSLMIDLAEVQEEQKVDEVICISSSPFRLKYNVKACLSFHTVKSLVLTRGELSLLPCGRHFGFELFFRNLNLWLFCPFFIRIIISDQIPSNKFKLTI